MALLVAAATVSPPPPTVRAQATASIRILSSARVTEASWKDAERRTDRIIQDATGKPVRIRAIEFE